MACENSGLTVGLKPGELKMDLLDRGIRRYAGGRYQVSLDPCRRMIGA
jgi:hypothetical protein